MYPAGLTAGPSPAPGGGGGHRAQRRACAGNTTQYSLVAGGSGAPMAPPRGTGSSLSRGQDPARRTTGCMAWCHHLPACSPPYHRIEHHPPPALVIITGDRVGKVRQRRLDGDGEHTHRHNTHRQHTHGSHSSTGRGDNRGSGGEWRWSRASTGGCIVAGR